MAQMNNPVAKKKNSVGENKRAKTKKHNSGVTRMAMKNGELNNSFFGVFIKKVYLAHIKHKVHIPVDLGTIVGSHPGDKIMFP